MTARPSLSLTAPMSPTRTPDDAHGLALTGDDGLAGRELGVELVRLGLEERDPQPLVLDDVVRNARARSRSARRSRRSSSGCHGSRASRLPPVRLRGSLISAERRRPSRRPSLSSRPSPLSCFLRHLIAGPSRACVARLVPRARRRAGAARAARRESSSGPGSAGSRTARRSAAAGAPRLRRVDAVSGSALARRAGLGHEVRPAGREHAEPLAVGVAGAALAGEADERLGRSW